MQWQDIIINRQVVDFAEEIDEVNAFVVSAVYPSSVAKEAKLTVGLYFVPQNKTLQDVKDLRFAQGEQIYVFYDKAEGQKIMLTLKGYPFGMALRRSVLGLSVALESDNKPDYEAAAAVIHEGDDRDFLKIAVAASQSDRVKATRGDNEGEGVGGLMALLKTSPTAAIEASASNDNKGQNVQADDNLTAEHFLMAAYLAFKDRADQARQFLPQSHDYAKIYGFGGGMASLYYLAQGYIAYYQHQDGDRLGKMEGIEAGASDPFDAVFMFQRAFELNPNSIRAAKMLEQLTGEKPQFEAFISEKFYDVYSFPAHDPQNIALALVKPPISYDETLKALKKGEFLLVILLGVYRANGFYSKAMTLLTQLYPLIGKHFSAIHIITAYDEGSPLKPHWLDGETFALECGLPVQVLYDEDNEICSDMEINSSPHGLIIDHNGMIIHRSALDEEEGYWLAASLGSGEPTAPPSADILRFPFGKS